MSLLHQMISLLYLLSRWRYPRFRVSNGDTPYSLDTRSQSLLGSPINTWHLGATCTDRSRTTWGTMAMMKWNTEKSLLSLPDDARRIDNYLSVPPLWLVDTETWDLVHPFFTCKRHTTLNASIHFATSSEKERRTSPLRLRIETMKDHKLAATVGFQGHSIPVLVGFTYKYVTSRRDVHRQISDKLGHDGDDEMEHGKITTLPAWWCETYRQLFVSSSSLIGGYGNVGFGPPIFYM